MPTIETWLRGIGLKQPIEECPAWPPDLFALAGTLLRRSGAYLRIFDRKGSSDYLRGIEQEAATWRKRIDEITVRPVTPSDLRSARVAHVAEAWAKLIASKSTPISELRTSCELTENLIRMVLIADEASAGIGIDWNHVTDTGQKPSKFLWIAEMLLYANKLQSFCWDVRRDVLCVLGKQHTPQKGATFRSLSHHLALYQPNEIEARWIKPIPKTVDGRPARDRLNLLLLPWPTRVATDDFHEVPQGGARPDGSTSPGYFRYEPKQSQSAQEFSTRLSKTLENARQQAGTIDAIVFPELALTEEQYYAAERIAFQERSILVCGLRQTAAGPEEWDANLSVLQVAGPVRGQEVDADPKDPLLENSRLFQAKHHRWYLDRGQIVNYQLGARLPASRGCWEHIELRQRVLHFVTLNSMTWSVLVCEDLARQDPAADLIRAVGPNLLVTLLMDGPQLSGRWPARYASVLAEDPGTSVLTLTSLGMAERSRPIMQSSGRRAEPSRVIALWRDAVEGEIQIALDAKDDACVLSLECHLRTEYCADGRGDGGQARYPIFAGYRSFKAAA